MMTHEFTKEENYTFWKKLVLGVIFFTIAPVTLGVSLFSLITLKPVSEIPLNISESGVRVYASLPNSVPTVSNTLEVSDARGEIIKQYLEKYNSPLISKADYLVTTADKYGLDFRLLTAIAQQESNLCKIIPPETYNCWGWGIHSRGTLGFKSYEEAIETVSEGLRKNYIDKGYITAEEIMSKYTPLSNGSWARGVNQFMGDMQ